MPRLTHRAPAYRLFKPRNLACVTIDGKRVYLGPYGSQESRDKYTTLIAEWEARGRRPYVPSRAEQRRAKAAVAAAGEPAPLTIVELVDRYLAWATSYYTKRDGTPSNQCTMIRAAVRPVVKFYSKLPARRFRPRHLKSVREAMVTGGWSRKTKNGKQVAGQYSRKVVNAYIARIVRMFAWAVEEELASVNVHQRLTRVRSLRRGKSVARDRPKVRAVSDATIERTMPWLTPTVRALVMFQRLTGARPSEACQVRPVDVDTSGEVWTYVPAGHKTEHHGHERLVFIGPRAQDVLRPLLLRPAEAPCFNPKDSERKRGRSKASRLLREFYDKNTYGRSVRRAIDRANRAETRAATKEEREPDLIPRWTPNMLRHTRATELRREFGVEAARVALGHSDAGITLVYAEADQKLAADVARRTG